MSRHNVHTQCRVMHDIIVLSDTELCEKYDIEIDDEGGVWDNTEGLEFDSLQDWATYIEEREREDAEEAEMYVSKRSHVRYEDE